MKYAKNKINLLTILKFSIIGGFNTPVAHFRKIYIKVVEELIPFAAYQGLLLLLRKAKFKCK